jgi:hypothetical protein
MVMQARPAHVHDQGLAKDDARWVKKANSNNSRIAKPDRECQVLSLGDHTAPWSVCLAAMRTLPTDIKPVPDAIPCRVALDDRLLVTVWGCHRTFGLLSPDFIWLIRAPKPVRE